MAKKNSGTQSLIGIAIVIGLVALIPKRLWIVLLVLGATAFIVWLLMKAFGVKKASRILPTYQPNKIKSRSPTTKVPKKEEVIPEPMLTISIAGNATNEEFSIPPAPPGFAGKARWITPGESITIGNLEIPGGMLYVGTGLKTARHDIEPALINPYLDIASTEVDCALPLNHTWPSYSLIGPDARKAYLGWLAGGRCSPSADIGYVFLFFYGLERRMLLNAQTAVETEAELPYIVAEIERLLDIYGENASFRRYAVQFLDFITTTDVEGQIYLTPPPRPRKGNDPLSLRLRIGLGQLVADQMPVPAEWALTWALSDPRIVRKTPVSRCTELFSILFKQRYAEIYGAGLTLKANRTRLRIAYSAASSALRYSNFVRTVVDLPDVSTVSRPVIQLQELVAQCTAELDPYSRYLGRNPDMGETLEGLLQLPVALWPDTVRSEIEALKNRVGNGLILMTFGELSNRLKSAGTLSRDKILGLARALESLHLGMEPDVLAGNRTPKMEDKIALFATPPEEMSARNTPVYSAAAITLDLACAAAQADGVVSPSELLHVTRQVDSWAHLDDAHRKRLKARLRLSIDQPLTLASLKTKMEQIPDEAKQSVGRFLIHLTQADGKVTLEEVKFLERVYSILKLDAQALYSELHAQPGINLEFVRATTETLQKADLEPDTPLHSKDFSQLQEQRAAIATVLSSVLTTKELAEPVMEEAASIEVSPQISTHTLLEEQADEPVSAVIPATGIVTHTVSSPASGFALDQERIAQLQKEAEEVAAFLAGIFSAEQASEAATEEMDIIEAPLQAAASVLGLNEDYSSFIRHLVSRHSWPKADLNDIAADMEIMLDGALEHINETIMDMFEALLAEGDDPIEINQEILEQLAL